MTGEPTHVSFKHEGEVNGEPIGPAKLVTVADAGKTGGQPYDAKRRVTWVTRSEALAMAEAAGVPLREV